MMRRAATPVLAVLLISLSASAQEAVASAPQESTPGSSKATVYVYRYKQFVGSALAPSVFCDSTELARMENGRYFAANLQPGQHSFTSNDKQAGINLDLKAGEQYFIRVEIAAGFAKGHGRLILVPKEQGSFELKSDKLKPLDADKVANKDLVSLDKPALASAAPEEPKK